MTPPTVQSIAKAAERAAGALERRSWDEAERLLRKVLADIPEAVATDRERDALGRLGNHALKVFTAVEKRQKANLGGSTISDLSGLAEDLRRAED
jgi:hypothetical protein